MNGRFWRDNASEVGPSLRSMAAIGNGLALHGGFIPYSGTFLTFSDYSRNALRMAALMRIRNILVFTHDSIGLGEDGPTSLALSRQNLPFVKRTPEAVAAIRRGGYVLSEAATKARAIIIATGSEVGIALAAQKSLAEGGIATRVVSMPCTSVFDRQDAAWKASVLPPGVPRVAIEAGVGDYWRKYVGLEGAVVSVDRFGESAPAPDVYKFLGIDADHLVAAVKGVV